ncbi:23S rRNA pseudouridine(1911/1915/1917) synthase RluD [Chiayiivirga flava]|uniref:Pseudouridine synthase n=1 Tax=Chiayiivirga flava TaxID=659595 RepID=A0A7W8D6V1_9GAMM|nr:23S rRNA pseudouridine(1911/1915/1917) synthase RluD [Chiayiivirga flava]MBB5208990.1 23S rRNA pseudouridine1911/1915/1917 synthase [Chiayiivirga flava]
MTTQPADTDTPPERRATQVPFDAAGQRFDQVLAALYPEFSRSRLAAWIKSGDARLDGKTVRPREAVRGGESVELDVRLGIATDSAPESIALDLLYEDADVFVVNKPVGLVVHPGAGNPAGTLVNALLHRDPQLVALPRAGIVHRLDKDTSGALIVARTLQAHTALVEQLAARTIHRQYEAIVYGRLISGGTVDAPLDRHPVDRLRRAVVDTGKPAVTHYRVRERYRAHTAVECQLETGRTHQIRVHMAHARHPLVGDSLYGGSLRLPKGATPALAEALRGFKRQALHAERIVFAHPRTGDTVEAQAPRPADLAALIATLRQDAAEE